MKFIIHSEKINEAVYVIYRQKEHSFDTLNNSSHGFSSVLLNEINLEVDETLRVISVWGLSSYEEWIIAEFPVPSSRIQVSLEIVEDIIPGVSIRIHPDNGGRWPIYVSPDRAWICIGNKPLPTDSAIQFLSNAMAVLKNNMISCVLIQLSH
jgi:hypothetical protein